MELTATAQQQLAHNSLPPGFGQRRSSLLLSFLSPARSYVLRVQPVIVLPEVTCT